MHRYKILFTVLMIGVTLLVTNTAVMAVSLRFEPVAQTADLGTLVDVDVVIADLGNGAAPSLGIFDIDMGAFGDSYVP